MTAGRRVRRRLFAEAGLACATLVLAIRTLIGPDWIEAIFGVDPDGGSGVLEWVIVGALAITTVISGLLAGAEWRRTAAA